MAELVIDDFLRGEGYASDAARRQGRAALEAAGLTRPGKVRMAATKRDAARDALALLLAPVCAQPACREALDVRGREVAEVDRAGCSVCGGSNNRRALRLMLDALRRRSLRRLLVVGGTPNLWRAMAAELSAASVELKFVDGTGGQPSQMDALRDCAWADCVVIWAPTPLPHKVSDRYSRDVCGAPHHVTVNRRGIEALAAEVVRHLAA